MAREINKLEPLEVERKRKPGYYADGNGLYLQVTKSKAGGVTKSWVLRYFLKGRTVSKTGKPTSREMGLGSLSVFTLAQARERARKFRALLADGIDPIQAREDEARATALEQARALTFDECAAAYIEAHKAGWKNAKHAAQWGSTLNTYASPVFGSLPIQTIDTTLVRRVLDPIWRTKTETASRVRGRIESVLSWATATGYRSGENPARWRGHLDNVYPERSKVAKVKHHAALPYAEAGSFMRDLRAREGVAPKALEFVILTAARVNEAVSAKWSEIDLREKLWTVPADRMKAGRPHRVPLSDAAVKLLTGLKATKHSDYVFPGWKDGKPITSAACLRLLDNMDRATLTVHGFRSTFRDWCAEQTKFAREVAEAALAHSNPDKTEAAYQRGDLLEKRRALMQEWADYCDQPKAPGKVVSIRKAG